MSFVLSDCKVRFITLSDRSVVSNPRNRKYQASIGVIGSTRENIGHYFSRVRGSKINSRKAYISAPDAYNASFSHVYRVYTTWLCTTHLPSSLALAAALFPATFPPFFPFRELIRKITASEWRRRNRV